MVAEVDEAADGILAIFNNVAAGREAEFDEWFQREHLAERIALPGFVLGRRYEAISGDRRFFNYYLTQSPEVLTSAAYLDRVNTPTPMTRRIMSEVFRDMVRTVCRRVLVRGAARGTAAMTVRFDQAPDTETLAEMIETQLKDHNVACGEAWSAVDTGLAASQEEQLRGGDRRIAACLVIETLRVVDAQRMAAALADRFAGASIGVFRLLCEIRPARP
jgi:hypothetical protein